MNKHFHIVSGGRVAALLAAVALCVAPVAASAAKGKGKAKGPARPAKEAAKTPAAKPAEAKPAEAKPAVAPARPEGAAPAANTNAAAVGEPSDALLLSGDNVVAVQPVFMIGRGNSGGWYDLAAQMATSKASAAAAAETGKANIAAPKAIDKGFGFAGASNAKDVRVLHQAVAIGFLPALIFAGNGAKAKQLATGLGGAMDALADLSPEAQASAKAFLALATDKADAEAIGAAFAQAMRAGMAGIAAGPQRPHGYYIAGVWSGMALLFASSGRGNATFADLAEPICVLLDKDAAFGGADRTIASHLRTIAAELKKESPQVSVVRAEVEAVLSVKPDEAKADAAPAQ
jgi:hypothetical protein